LRNSDIKILPALSLYKFIPVILLLLFYRIAEEYGRKERAVLKNRHSPPAQIKEGAESGRGQASLLDFEIPE